MEGRGCGGRGDEPGEGRIWWTGEFGLEGEKTKGMEDENRTSTVFLIILVFSAKTDEIRRRERRTGRDRVVDSEHTLNEGEYGRME